MKEIIKRILQTTLGIKNYLFLFSIFTILTLRWKRKEKDFMYFIQMIPDDGIVLDIGANIGIMTVHLARKLSKSKIICFEPVPCNLFTLKKIISFFNLKNIEVVETALGNQNGQIEMVLPVINSVKMQGLSHVVHQKITEFNQGEIFKVPVQTLDSFAEKNALEKINAIKIDVENFEYFVFEGGKNLIETHHPLIYCELWDNENRQKCFIFLKNLNYTIKIISNKKLEKYDSEIHQTQNFFFIHENSRIKK